MSSQSVYNEIISQVKRIYESYEQKANQMAEDKRQRTGNKVDKNEDEFLKSLTELEKNLGDLVGDMRKQEKGSTNQYRENIAAIEDCLRDIRTILKKKPLNFKVNQQIKEIITDTEASLIAIRKDLATIKDTKFLCCGTDGNKKFKTPMSFFKIFAGKWKMLTLFESKDGVQTFFSPKFSQGQYQFIADILKKKWPESKVIEVQKPVIKEVIREVRVGTGQQPPSALIAANEYLFGINRQENLIEGLEIYQKEADKNNPQANCFLGKVYQDGILLPMDLRKSQAYYQRAMNQKDPYAHYRFAMCLIKGKYSKDGQRKEDIEKGFNILNQIANDSQNPSAEAMAELGEIYEYGNFNCDSNRLFTIKKDLNKAVSYFTKARNMKLPRASNNLGVLYLNIKMDEQQSAKSEMNAEQDRKIIQYLNEAQEQGFSQAYYNLGIVYSKGLAGQKNSELALKMFYQGSIKGDYKCKIKFAYELMNQTSIMKQQYEDHYHLAIQWLQSVVRKLSINEESVSSDPPQMLKSERGQALFYLGVFHEHGFGVQKSAKKAINYFIESSGLDYPAAKNKIGDCYFSGYGLKQDRQLAIGCYLQAEQLGNSDAMVNLGTVYLNGIPGLIERSYKKSYQYFLKAHELQNSDAMIHLSYIYRNGLGVEPNEQVARDLLEQAAQLRNATALYMLKEQGLQFNQGVLFEHLQNEFFYAPKKINLKEIVPVVYSINKSK